MGHPTGRECTRGAASEGIDHLDPFLLLDELESDDEDDTLARASFALRPSALCP